MHAHLHTQQRCAQLQERLQEQQRECLQLQSQLNAMQDNAARHATETARLTTQLRDAHAASIGAIEEGDRRVASAETARAQVGQVGNKALQGTGNSRVDRLVSDTRKLKAGKRVASRIDAQRQIG